MTKEQINKIRPEARKLVIKSYIIDLTHQLYRNIWLKLEIVIIMIQLMFMVAAIVAPMCGVKTLPTSLIAAIGSWIFCILIILGSIISHKAMKKAQETKTRLYDLIDSMTSLIIVNENECEVDENEE